MDLLTIVGYIAEAAGIVLAFYGLHRTFRQYAPGQREIDPLIVWLRMRRESIHNRLREARRRLGRRPKDIRVAAGFAQGTLTMSGRVSVRKGYGYPSDRTIKAVVATVQARTQELITRTEELDDKCADEVDARIKADDDLAARIDVQSRRLDETARDLAVGGLRLQLVGLSLVTLGLVLQGIGQAI